MDNFVSIVIPARNEERYLQICLEGVRCAISTWGGDAEIILVDNDSTDSSKEIAVGKGCKVIQCPGGSIAKLRNLGAKESKGNIIAFLDADCLVSPEWICFCIEKFEDPMIGIVGTRAIPDLKQATWVEEGWWRIASGAKRADFVRWIGSSNMFIRRETFEESKGFDENLMVGEDVDFCYRVGRKYLIYLEKRIDTIHLRESKTIGELFKREFWRGQDSVRAFVGKRFIWNDLPSIILPGVNLLSIISVPALIMFKEKAFVIPLLVFLLLPGIFIIKKKSKINSLTGFLKCYLIALVYIHARSCSLVYEIRNYLGGIIKSKKRYDYCLK